jgi:hypothetical protein
VVQQQKGQQPSDPPVAIDEGVNALEIQDETGDEQQRVCLAFRQRLIEPLPRRCMNTGVTRAEPDGNGPPPTVGPDFHDGIVSVFPLASFLACESVHRPMPLENELRRKTQDGMAEMDVVQDLTIAGDLLFRPVRGAWSFDDQFRQSFREP